MSVWYREGTVALTNNSPVVTGTGTHWTTVGIDPGDMFQVNGAMYEIGSIESDTELTLVGNYTGATSASVVYAIIPNYAVRPYSTVVGRQMLLLDKWVRREQELVAWQTTPASGDPLNPSKVTITAWNGLTQDVISLPEMIAQAGAGGVSSWNDLQDIPTWLITGNLADWAAITPASKQNASANLTAWAGIAVTAKQDASANLSLWSSVHPNRYLSVTGGEMEAPITFVNGSDEWMLIGDMGGLYADVDGIALTSGTARLKITPTDLTFRSQNVWWAGNFNPANIPDQIGNIRITKATPAIFLESADGLETYSRWSYNGTDVYLTSESGRMVIRPNGFGSSLGQLDITTTDIKWAGKSLLHSESDLSDLPFVPKAGGTMTGILSMTRPNESWMIERTGTGGIWATSQGVSLVSSYNGGWTALNVGETNVVSNKAFWVSFATSADFIAEGTGDLTYFVPNKAFGGYHGRAMGGTRGTMHYRAVDQWTETSQPTMLDIRLVRTGETTTSDALRITNERLMANFSAGATAAAGAGRMYLQSNVAAGVSNVSVLPGVGGNHAILSVFNSSDPANASVMQFGISPDGAIIGTTATGTGVAKSIILAPNGNNVIDIRASHEVILPGRNANASAERTFSLVRGDNVFWMNAKGSAGSWNPAIRANESTLLFTGGTSGTGTMFIGAWHSQRVGIRIYGDTASDGSAFGIEGGSVGTQFSHIAMLQSGNRLWGMGIETDRAWKLWQYSDVGVYQSNPLTVFRGDSDSRITAVGGFFSTGSQAGIKFAERDGNSYIWTWYGHNGGAYLWNNRINASAFGLTSDGNVAVRGNISIGNQLYVTQWLRSQTSGSGWYHEVHGGGWFMSDNNWIRSYNLKGVLIAGGGSGSDFRIESIAPTITCYDTNAGTTHWLHCNDGNHGFLANNSFAWCAYRDANNNWSCTGNVIAYASDVRLKRNFKPIMDPLGKLAQIDGYLFDWDEEACKAAGFTPRIWTEHGLAAQQIQKILPDIVVPSPANEDYLTVMYDRMTPFLVSVDKAQQRLIEEQANRIRDLEDRLARIEKALGV